MSTRELLAQGRDAGHPALSLPRVGAALRHTGSLGLAALTGAGLLLAELQLARRAIPSRSDAPRGACTFGPASGPRVRLAVLGDSCAAGVGCDLASETPGGLLAAALAGDGYAVRLDVWATSGARSSDLEEQVDQALALLPDIVVMFIGANDVTHFVPAEEAAALLGDAVARLTDAGVRVVVATCPDLGTIRPVPQPLRQVGHHLSRRMSRAQARAVYEAGGVPVDIGRSLGPSFRRGPELFSADRFHPSARGYAALTGALTGPVAELLGQAASPVTEPLGEAAGPRPVLDGPADTPPIAQVPQQRTPVSFKA